jgi:hypothetical protein
MDSALLQNLIAGAGSSSQLIGGLVVALLYSVIGLLSAIGSIFVFRRMFQGRWEQIFWACFLVVIAAFCLSFAAYFAASPSSLFVLCADCFPELLLQLAMSCMGSGIYPIPCQAHHLPACR